MQRRLSQWKSLATKIGSKQWQQRHKILTKTLGV
jgi:hypothetical protein